MFGDYAVKHKNNSLIQEPYGDKLKYNQIYHVKHNSTII